jgi:hypothetical protein
MKSFCLASSPRTAQKRIIGHASAYNEKWLKEKDSPNAVSGYYLQ